MNRYPVHIRARREAPLSRWLWLVKWLMLIPHYIVLAFLWVAFVACTLVAYVAVLFTGRYPHAIFTFNVGVLRWSWRVGYYGYQVLGTDRYPPFTLADVPDYPAGLDIDYPPRHPRWLPLVAWLLAIPHIMILSALTATGSWQFAGDGATSTSAGLSLVGAAVLIIGFALLFTGRHLVGLYNLLVGVARWSLRVIAYVALLTATYPPFRLDQGETEPDDTPDDRSGPVAAAYGTPPATAPPATAPPTGTSAVGSVLALVVGALMLLGGVALGIGGTALLALNTHRDAHGYVSTATLGVSSPTAAITAEGINIQAGDAWSRDLGGFGDVRITATSRSGAPLFVGIAAQSDVDRWLAGTAHDELVNVYGRGSARYDRAIGSIRDLGTPGEQDFWLAKVSGTGTITLDWKMTNGRYAVMLANADGARGVTATVRAATKVPDLTPLGWGLLGGGVAIAVVAFLLIYLGATGLGRRHAPPSPVTGPSGPPPAPSAPPERTPVGSAPGTGAG
jgi:Domain of unknown function (DUF4389)